MTTMRAANLLRARPRQISGPMPAGSPEVTAMTGTEFEPDATAARDTAGFSGRAFTVLRAAFPRRRDRATAAAIPEKPRHPFCREEPCAPRRACARKTCRPYAARAPE